jgi:hypothetical protein
MQGEVAMRSANEQPDDWLYRKQPRKDSGARICSRMAPLRPMKVSAGETFVDA